MERIFRDGLCTAQVIADTEWQGHRITTLELVYPRYIHSEFMTHRVFSRNAQSSRATPTKTLLSLVADHPVVPKLVYMNRPGMVGTELTDFKTNKKFRFWWSLASRCAAFCAKRMLACGIHKQHVNRILEPFLNIKVVVTATDWDNFFDLRLAPDAQPEIRDLARCIKAARTYSIPKKAKWHFPYVTEEELEQNFSISDLCSISAARCARVSYLKFDQTKPSKEDDLRLAKRLSDSKHLTPWEHCARAAQGRHANFEGWQSCRNHKGE